MWIKGFGERISYKTPTYAEDLLRSHGVEVVHAGCDECVQMMAEFIVAEPTLWNEDIGEVDTGP